MGRPRHSSAQVSRLLLAMSAEPARWRYGYDLSAEAGISAGTMYPALARLADDGLLEHRWKLPAETGRPRHLYRLTAAGVEFAARRASPDRATDRPSPDHATDRPSPPTAPRRTTPPTAPRRTTPPIAPCGRG